MKSQLFRRNPDRYIISLLLEIFNIESLDNEKFYFTKQDISKLNIGDYWEFDCCPSYESSLNSKGELNKPTSENFLGEFGFMLLQDHALDSGFEIMMANSDNELKSQKLSYFYTIENDAYWKLTDNLHVAGSLQLETKTNPATSISNQGQLIYRNDKKAHLINEDGFDSVIENDLASQFDVSLWNVSNDEIVHTCAQVSIGDAYISSNYQLRVKGNVQITGALDAAAGDLKAGNIDATGSLSVSGFKSTNLNTQNLTIEDRNFQVGFIDVALIDNLNSNVISARIDHKLETNDYAYFQDTNIYFNTDPKTSINGFRKIKKESSSSLKVYDDAGALSNVTYLTINPPRYIGVNNITDSVINNLSTFFTGTEAVRVRIIMTASNAFKYSLNGGFTYINSSQTIADTSTLYYLGTSIVNTSSSNIGIAIKFTTISGLSIGDYWEFDCSPPYIVTQNDAGQNNPPTETNFLGEFGKVYPRNELLDSGFEIMMRNPSTYTLE